MAQLKGCAIPQAPRTFLFPLPSWEEMKKTALLLLQNSGGLDTALQLVPQLAG